MDDPDGDGTRATGKPEVWRLKDDDRQSRAPHRGDNGDAGGEHWKVTTGDGAQYVFGMNRLPGAGKPEPYPLCLAAGVRRRRR